MQTTLFDGTLLAEILAYTGEMGTIAPPEAKLFSEKEVGEMTQLEKTIHALYHAKFKEHNRLLKNIGAEKTTDGKLDLRATLKKATQEQIKTIERLLLEATYLRGWLWDLLHLRFPEGNGITIQIRPGYKVVIGMSADDIIEAYGLEGTVEVIVV